MTRIHAILVMGIASVGIGFALIGGFPSTAAEPQTAAIPTAPATQKDTDSRPADREGIQNEVNTFAAAFQKGDAKAVTALWTAQGEYISDDGATFSGRAALEKAYAEFFAKNPDNSMEVEVTTIRFPSRDNAVVEGYFKRRHGKTKELTTSRCSLLYAREDGKWLIAIAREWPGDGLSLRDLEWLIGTWEAKQGGTVVTTKYEWTTNKTFIRCQLSITQDGRTVSGMQMIGKMPSTGGLHIWTFEDAGGIGDADISREGKKWLFAARGSTADGQVITATNILTPLDSDSFLWQAVERTLDGEAISDIPPIKVVRVKATK